MTSRQAGRLLVLTSMLVAATSEVMPQTRDVTTAPTIGTASIAGTVVDDRQPPRPVRRAVVTLSGEGLRPSRGAITDDEGRFELRDLPAGRFTLTAERRAYVTSAYGAKRPGRTGTPITLAEGQRLASLRVRLWRGAVVSGVLRDEAGRPLARTAVEAVPARRVTPLGLTLSNNGLVQTNELGEYRIYGLEPGTYVVRGGSEPRGISGRVQVARSETEIDAIFAALARGRTPTVAGPPASARPSSAVPLGGPAAGTQVSSAPIYYPGTPVVTEATRITLTAGEERDGMDFVVRRIPVAEVRGRVVGPAGTPVARALLELRTTVMPTSFADAAPAPVRGAIGSEGAFEIGPISPGDYRLLVRADVGSAGGPGPASPWWAVAPVSTAGADVDLGTLALRPGLSFSGRIQFAEDGASPVPDLAGARVTLQSDSLTVGSAAGRGRANAVNLLAVQPGVVEADGRFEIAGLVPGEYRLDVTGGAIDGAVWWLRSAIWQGRDLLDAPLQLGPNEPMRDVTLVLSDRRTSLSGTIATPAGAAVTDLFVIVFPADAALRASASRRVRAVRPDSAGRFVLERLPGGEYLLCALADVEDGEWNEPGYLDRLVGASVPVTLRDGEITVQNLQVR